jgi:hypothetical protein
MGGGGIGGYAGNGDQASAGISGSAGAGGYGGGALAACVPVPAKIPNPCVYTVAPAAAPLDLTVRGSLTSSGTTPPVGLATRCLHTSQYFFTVQDTAGQSTTVGYNVAGVAGPSLASLVGQTVSLRVRLNGEFQIDTDSVGFALQDGAGGLLFAAYGGNFYFGRSTMLLAAADLQGMDITAAEPLCAGSSEDCAGSAYYALQFQGSSTITLPSSASGSVDAGGASYLAYHVSTFDPGHGCSDAQGWQGWSLTRDDL